MEIALQARRMRVMQPMRQDVAFSDAQGLASAASLASSITKKPCSHVCSTLSMFGPRKNICRQMRRTCMDSASPRHPFAPFHSISSFREEI